MNILIRPTQKPQDFPALAALLSAVEPEWPVTVEMLELWEKNRNPKMFHASFVAVQDGKIVAEASTNEDDYAYEAGKYWVGIRVHPDARKQGIGETLFQLLLKTLQEKAPHPITKLMCGFKANKPQNIRFVEQRGFVQEWQRYESRLQTDTFDFAPYAHIEQQLADAGLQIKSLAELMESDPQAAHKLYELDWILFQDVPMGVTFTKREFEQWCKEEVDDPHFVREACMIALDPHRNDPLTGSMVGYSSLMKNPAGFWGIGMTGVLREYRGKALAKALKLRGVAYIQSHGGGEIRTWNDPPNMAMLTMNLQLGFRPEPPSLRYMKRLDGVAVEPFNPEKYQRVF